MATQGDTQSYHFSLGNATHGAVGFCARVDAHSAKEAAEILRDALPSELRVPVADPRVAYVEVYFNHERPTARDATGE